MVQPFHLYHKVLMLPVIITCKGQQKTSPSPFSWFDVVTKQIEKWVKTLGIFLEFIPSESKVQFIKHAKGQIISECFFDFVNFPKKHRKIWQISAQKSKKCSNHKITAPYSVFDTLNSPYNHRIIRKCLYFVDLTTF